MRILFLIVIVLAFSAAPGQAFSVLAHEAIIDFTWEESMVPAIQARFPDVQPAQLLEARQYAYGGCLIQDMGYYPFGSRLFTDLLHYVRSADFVEALIRESQSVNEYAFALGALSHYASDIDGHSLATNIVVPILYPELRKKYGDEITYEEKPSAHLKAEFGYDVLQVARGRYQLESYHSFIGFDVSLPVLERAFFQTYGLKLEDVFGNLDLAVGTYRHTVSEIVPELTRVAWDLKKDEILQSVPGATAETFLFRISRKNYEEKWGSDYRKPGCFARFLGFLARIIPKFGPFKALDFRPPTPATEKLFLASMGITLNRYEAMLREVKEETFEWENRDLDTGKATRPGEYRKADQAYADLLQKLSRSNFRTVTPELRSNILSFYEGSDLSSKKTRQLLRKLQSTP